MTLGYDVDKPWRAAERDATGSSSRTSPYQGAYGKMLSESGLSSPALHCHCCKRRASVGQGIFEEDVRPASRLSSPLHASLRRAALSCEAAVSRHPCR